MTTRANLYVDQNTDYATSLNLFTDSGEEFDITTQDFVCDVRKIYSTKVLFSPTLVIEPAGEIGVIELEVSAEDTKDLEPGKYQYDIVMKDGSRRHKILEGLMFILPTVTRSNGS
jgi:hypothetical protein